MVCVVIDGKKHEIKTEKQWIEFNEIIKENGHYEDVAICPFCNEAHQITQYNEFSVMFYCSEECFFNGIAFSTKRSAILKMKKMAEILGNLKNQKPEKKPYIEPELKTKNYSELHREERKAVAIELIKKLQKNSSQKQIANDLNEAGLLTVSGKQWTDKNIFQFIKNNIKNKG